MIKAEQESEELSAAERRLLAAFVVPPPSKAMEDQLMRRVQLQRQVQAPDELARRRWTRPLAIVVCVAAAAGLIWMIDVERSGSSFTSEAPTPSEHSAEKPPVLPAAARPQTTWVLRGSAPEAYAAELDPEMRRNGRATQVLRSTQPIVGFGTWMRSVDAGPYVGKRVRLSAFVKSESVDAWAGLWMRVDAEDGRTAFDNMEGRAITGTTDWTRYEVVLDVADGATSINYGILLNGAGATWIDEIALEAVNTDVAVTGGTASGHGPTEWTLSGSAPQEYETGAAPQVERDGQASRFLRSSTADPYEFGTWMRAADATSYRGKRVRLAAWLRADAVDGWAGLWMRVDPETVRTFDNMSDRPIDGTREWARYEVVLDVAEGATHIAYGVLLNGKGKVWLDDLQLEVVAEDVPVTATQTRPGLANRLLDWVR